MPFTSLARLISTMVFSALLVLLLESSMDITMAALTGASYESPNSYRWMMEALARARMSSTTTTPLSTASSISSSEMITTAASAASTTSFIVAIVYLSCVVAVLISRSCW